MKIFNKTRKFRSHKFKEVYGHDCSLRTSGGTRARVWLGLTAINKIGGNQMLLEKRQAWWLIKKLIKFIFTGNV